MNILLKCWFALSILVLIVAGILLGGDVLYSRQWFSESMKDLSHLHQEDTLETFGERMLSPQLRELFRKGFRIAKHNEEQSFLVSFQRFGLALVQGNKLTFIGETEDTVLSRVTKDNHVFYFVGEFASPHQELVHAVIDGTTIKELWKKKLTKRYLHHWGDEFAGLYYHPSRLFPKTTICNGEKAIRDALSVFDVSNGEFAHNIEILPIVLKSENAELKKQLTMCKDPLHLNSVRLLRNEREAQYFPGGKVGDLLLSLRNVHALVLLDKDTHDIKWDFVGGDAKTFRAQHSPRVTDRGTVVLFDNVGGDIPNGRSRIVEIDIASKDIVGMYESTGEDYFYSEYGGKVDYRDGRVYVSDEQARPDLEEDAVTYFVLDCPGTYISNDCTRTDIFRGTDKHLYLKTSVLAD